ncbi:hypothetical protein W97_02529 [Coniosporium apollinis CBS 100218]|uniref:Uncharacterized protein n=1 Tax=Coniosporium apollinis (strain CBS 100218) TaxID=1168221 RepID=R7YN25_CONA1|nr:uncharacterized protein W97_02529 [Coniosporium apollinis CBS 100218]EON63302.1 hypothetical protein W97_02529 [Coniosporium apollinis CBS 100218]
MSFTGRVEPLELDVDRCVALHNHILSIALAAPENSHIHVQQNYFEYWTAHEVAHNGSTESIERTRESLEGDPILEFLERINVVDWGQLSLTPHIRGLPEPGRLLHLCEGFYPFDYGKAIKLYSHHDTVSELEPGLFFDAETNTCTFTEAMFMPTPEDENVWVPLDHAFQRWVDLIEEGKYIVSPEEKGDECEPTGWKFADDAVLRIEETLKEWKNYIELVASKIPGHRASPSSEPLIKQETLDCYRIEGFVGAFLGQARKPDFEFVAPGLTIPSEDFMTEIGPKTRQDLEGFEDSGKYDVELMLFPLHSDHHLGLSLLRFFSDYQDSAALIWPMDPDEKQRMTWAPAEKFFGRWGPEFQHGPCPYLPRHQARLGAILRHWQRLVQDGMWEVDGNGISTSYERLKSPELREKLLLPTLCE